MKFDYSLLLKKIHDLFGTEENFAKEIGESPEKVRKILAGEDVWSLSEICRSLEALDINDADADRYFFAVKL